MWGRIERWFWLWVYSTLYFLGLSVTYAVWTEDVTEGTRPALAEIGAPLLALCAALTVLSNTVNANKVAKIPLQDVAPAIFAVISAYFWVASTNYVNRHPNDWELIGGFTWFLALPAIVVLFVIMVFLLLGRLKRRIDS